MPKPSLLLNFLDCWLPISSIPSPADNALTAFGMPLIVGDIPVSRGLLPHFSTSSIRTLVRGVYFPAAQFRTSKKNLTQTQFCELCLPVQLAIFWTNWLRSQSKFILVYGQGTEPHPRDLSVLPEILQGVWWWLRHDRKTYQGVLGRRDW